MGKSSRKARRQARKAKRAERRDSLKMLIGAIQNANITSLPEDDANPPTFISQFNEIWPILKPALKFAISLKLTNDQVDKVLDEILKAGDAVANGGTDASGAFIEKFKMAWDKVERVLELVQIVTPNNVDKILDDVIEIGDWIAGE
jgi:hypothetical protein